MRTALVVLLLAAATAGCGDDASPQAAASPSPSTETLTVRGDVELPVSLSGMLSLPESDFYEGGPCLTEVEYRDVALAGTPVIIADDSGTTLGLTELRAPTLTPGPTGGAVCDLGFVVTGVPDGLPFYNVKVGQRPPQKFTREQVAQLLTVTPPDA
jgi:hypothetical protein